MTGIELWRSCMAAGLLTIAGAAVAAPTQIAHQGTLTDTDGPVTGSVSMVFRLFAADSGGTVVWSETQQVAVVDGRYAVLLGDGGSPDLLTVLRTEPALWLEIAVEGSTLLPRQAIGAAPYAVVADTAENVVGGTVDAASIAVNGTTVVDGSGAWTGGAGSLPWTRLADVPAGVAGMGSLSCSDGQPATWATGTWSCGPLLLAPERVDGTGATVGDVLTWDGGSAGWAPSGGGALVAVDPALPPGGVLTVQAGTADVLAQGWVEQGASWTPIAPPAVPRATSCDACGNGSDGDSAVFPFNGFELAGEYDFTAFDVPGFVTYTGGGTTPVVIRSTGPVSIYGVIDFDGEAASGSTPGMGRAAGYSGGGLAVSAHGYMEDHLGSEIRFRGLYCVGTRAPGPGGAIAIAGLSPSEAAPPWLCSTASPCNGTRSLPGGSASPSSDLRSQLALSRFLERPPSHGGSGGGGGCALVVYGASSTLACTGGGAGGAGGGVVAIAAPSIEIVGTIRARGGAGSTAALTGGSPPFDCTGSLAGGDGGGGAIWLRGTTVHISGTVDAGNGVVRIDAHEVTGSGVPTDAIYGDAADLPPLFEVAQASAGTITLSNRSRSARGARLVVTR